MGKIFKAWRRLAQQWGFLLIVVGCIAFIAVSWASWGGWAIAISNVLAILTLISGIFWADFEGKEQMVEDIWFETSDTHQQDVDKVISYHYRRGYADGEHGWEAKPLENHES